jgi:carboxyl-terminal processing protease
MPQLFPRFVLFLFVWLAVAGAEISFVHPAYAEEKKEAPKEAAKDAKEKDDPDATDTYKYLSLFSDVLERVRADYVDPVTDEKLIESSLNGMLVSLDPHSGYLNKKNFQEMQTQTRGEFGGLGIEVTMDDGIVKIVSPIDDTPAAKAKLEPGDLITHIDDHPVTELTLSEAVDRMRGKPGTKIKLTLRRGGLTGKPFDVTLVRAIIKIKSVKSEIKEKDIGYIRITTFNEQTQTGLDDALNEFDKKLGDKVVGYVVDLRNNPGGLLEQAISVSSTFLPAGVPVVSTRGRHTEDNQVFLSKGGDHANSKPVVVMVNNGSASASEIVAGALQDHRRAIVIGTKSFGKGSVQTIIPLQNGSAIRLTTARYYTPNGRSIQALGIEPDISVQPAKVELVKSDRKSLHEADLRGALINEQKAKDAAAKDKDKAKPEDGSPEEATTAPATDEKSADTEDDDNSADTSADKSKDKDKKAFDYQLSRALDLLRGIALYEKRSGEQYVPPGKLPVAEPTTKPGG